jgi:hypothetical protein
MALFKLNRTQVLFTAILALSALLGSLYILCVPPGLPYDEPAHFANVRYYATHLHLPLIGAPETSYEAYQSPLYYVLAVPLDRLARPFGVRAEFYLLRMAGLLLLAPLGVFAYRIADRVFGGKPTLALLATAFVCLNPALLAIAASIQNDMLAIVLACCVLDAVGRYVQDQALTTRSAIYLGVLISLAMLAKMSVLFLPIPIAWFVWSRHGRASVRYMIVLLGSVALATGWWFVRNKMLYGDFMGVHAMQKLVGQDHPGTIALWQPEILVPYLRNFLAHSWLPVDYFRSVVKSSLWERSIVLASTVVAGFGWWLAGRDPQSKVSERSYAYRKFLFLAYGVCFGIYIYTYVCVNPYPPRVLYPMFIVYAIYYAFGLRYIFQRYAAPQGRAAVGVFSILLLLLSMSICRKAKAYHDIDFLPLVNQAVTQTAQRP